MPFCTQCGRNVHDQDAFCAHCGARQGAPAGPPPPPITPEPLANFSPRTAAILCYVPVIGWIAAVIVLAARRFKTDRMVRFHAFQGLYLFAAWLVVDWVIAPISRSMQSHYFPIDHVLRALILVVSIFMMVKASHGEPYVLPIIGELAQKSANEQ